jgi:hypothetical protein
MEIYQLCFGGAILIPVLYLMTPNKTNYLTVTDLRRKVKQHNSKITNTITKKGGF